MQGCRCIDLREPVSVCEGMILRGWDMYEAGSPKGYHAFIECLLFGKYIYCLI